jgi:methyl-accepting chemotaxis protein
MATGDLTTKVSIKNRDELGSLASAFNTMQDSFNNVLSNILVASTEVKASSKEVSESSTSLSQGAAEQASTIEELTVQVEDICNQMKLNSDNTQKANSLAVMVNNNAREGSHIMENLQAAMLKINETSHDISKIIKVIDDMLFKLIFYL